jgi:hypothetical protein
MGQAAAPGTIVITYADATQARQGNAAINNAVLALQPFLSQNQDVIWRCGEAAAPAAPATANDQQGTPSGDSANLTTVLGKYLPSSCRQ